MSSNDCCYQTPELPITYLLALIKNLYNIDAVYWQSLCSYDDKNFLIRQRKQSRQWEASEYVPQDAYTLKVTNQRDSDLNGFIEAQTLLLLHIRRKGLLCPEPLRNLDGNYLSLQKIEYGVRGAGIRYGCHMIRLLRYIPGELLGDIKITPCILQQLGKLVASFQDCAKDFHHGFYNSQQKPMWSLHETDKVKLFAHYLADDNKQSIVEGTCVEFSKALRNSSLPSGIIHSDFNEKNVLVKKSSESGYYEIIGFIDVGDSHFGYLVFDLAIAICYMMLLKDSISLPLEQIGAFVVRGYSELRTLSSDEWKILKKSICARLCQSLTYGHYSWIKNSTKYNEYVLETQKHGWKLLETLTNDSVDNFMAGMEKLCTVNY